ncbi:MAG: hypothetical protein V4850_04880 [Myxococcota bacterium]
MLLIPALVFTSCAPRSTDTDTPDTETGSVAECESAPTGLCPACDLDVVIRCGGSDFGAPGVRVGVEEAGAWLVTSSADAPYVFDVDTTGATARPGVPAWFTRAQTLVAEDIDGALHLLAYGSGDDIHDLGLEYGRPTDDAWTLEEVAGRSHEYGLEIAPDGTPRVWLDPSPPGHRAVATRTSGGWRTTDLDLPEDTEWGEFSLDANGETVAVGVDYAEYVVNVLLAGEPIAISPIVPSTALTHWSLARLPPARAVAGAPVALVTMPAAGLQVSFVQDSSVDTAPTAFPIPDTALLVSTCTTLDWDKPCPEPCHDTGVGLGPLDAEYAAARAEDGAVWVAYVVLHRDQQITYAWSEGDGDGDTSGCDGTIVSDASYTLLHVVRVDTDGSVETRLTLPIDGRGPFTGWEIGLVHGLDLAVADGRVALALRTDDPASDEIYQNSVRVLTFPATAP